MGVLAYNKPLPTIPAASYQGHRFPAEIIAHAVWRYFRFPRSYRPVAEILAARGIVVSYAAIREWCRQCGQPYANALHRQRPQPGDTWHLDEVFLKINGQQHYRWRAVDQHGNVLDILVTSRRDTPTAQRFFRKILKRYQYVPRVIAQRCGAHHHGQTRQLRSGEAGNPAGGGASPA
jgi:putative transposase